MTDVVTAAQQSERKKRRVVYSALLGDYENLVPRPVTDSEYADHVFLTDSPRADPGAGWNIVRVEPHFPSDSVRSARRLKILGHPSIAGYDESLWLDNRVAIRAPLSTLFDSLSDSDLAVPYHSYRESVRAEFLEVIASGYDDPTAVRKLYAIARDADVVHERPYWTGMLLRAESHDVRMSMERWYEYLLLTTRRDQLSLNIALSEFPNLRLRALDIENRQSAYHEWVSTGGLNRNKAIQMWRPARRGPVIAFGDLLRSRPYGRKFARLLDMCGIGIPILPD